MITMKSEFYRQVLNDDTSSATLKDYAKSELRKQKKEALIELKAEIKALNKVLLNENIQEDVKTKLSKELANKEHEFFNALEAE
jgi:hypothetical protein